MEKGLPKAAGGKIPSELKVQAQCGVYRTRGYSCGVEVRGKELVEVRGWKQTRMLSDHVEGTIHVPRRAMNRARWDSSRPGAQDFLQMHTSALGR